MKNQYGFIPKRYRQPDNYRLIFNGWCAIYIHPKTDVEYHLQLKPHYLSSSYDEATQAEVLRQDKDGRRLMCPPLKTIKAAIEIIEKLLNKEEKANVA